MTELYDKLIFWVNNLAPEAYLLELMEILAKKLIFIWTLIDMQTALIDAQSTKVAQITQSPQKRKNAAILAVLKIKKLP